ncbi:hypothetical protein L2E82_32375 [Cichorium intybus]|uniref:Uncharacterized protein n=1 Tax=Cichorium intybus TaxID=13427 RepID=A0ACB9BHC4_CICIN|nr:hypothetical protein L2E82_32375 [Cichorium intybus]
MDNQILNPISIIRARQLQAVNLICLLVAFLTRRRLPNIKHANLPTREVLLQRRSVREEMLHDLANSGKCRELIRAIDGTHFTYVLTGWEGTASDSRIIKNALTRDDKLLIPRGRYCLVDAGLPHTSTLMTPYRGVRYHLKEYSTRAPENSKELFNLRHASLRNAIERAFGVLKKRFPIIRKEDRDKALEEEVMHELLNAPHEKDRHSSRDIREGSTRVEQLRNSIANAMWANYLLHPNNEIDMSK